MLAAAWLTAVSTALLALFAVVTAVFALLAFRKQSAEVAILQGQARDQAEMLKVQAEQLEAQHAQLGEQRKVNEKQIGVLELQTDELRASVADREREAAERRRAQARLIAAVLGREERPPDEAAKATTPMELLEGRTAAELINSSSEPVYRVVIGIVFVQGAGPRDIEAMLDFGKSGGEDGSPRRVPVTTASILPPGTHRAWIRGIGWSAILAGRSAVEVAFTDRAGAHWIRRASGQLEELPGDPILHFISLGMDAFLDLQTPERLS